MKTCWPGDTVKETLGTTTSPLGVTMGTLSNTNSPLRESRTKPLTLGTPASNSRTELFDTMHLSYLKFMTAFYKKDLEPRTPAAKQYNIERKKRIFTLNLYSLQRPRTSWLLSECILPAPPPPCKQSSASPWRLLHSSAGAWRWCSTPSCHQ